LRASFQHAGCQPGTRNGNAARHKPGHPITVIPTGIVVASGIVITTGIVMAQGIAVAAAFARWLAQVGFRRQRRCACCWSLPIPRRRTCHGGTGT
jgi:hypothetical protein